MCTVPVVWPAVPIISQVPGRPSIRRVAGYLLLGFRYMTRGLSIGALKYTQPDIGPVDEPLQQWP